MKNQIINVPFGFKMAYCFFRKGAIGALTKNPSQLLQQYIPRTGFEGDLTCILCGILPGVEFTTRLFAFGDQNIGRSSANAPANHPAGDLIKIPGRVDIFVTSPCLFDLASRHASCPGLPTIYQSIRITPIVQLLRAVYTVSTWCILWNNNDLDLLCFYRAGWYNEVWGRVLI